MKVDNSTSNTGSVGLTPTQTPTQNRTSGGKSVGKTGSGSTSSSNVQLSSQLQGLQGQVASSSVFDANKVEEIKAAIAGGQFQVDPEKVANGLLGNTADLLQTQTA